MEPMLRARGLNKRYGRVTALDDCDFELMPGEILAVIGDNGAGKTSLIKALSGAINPDSGDIYLEGKKVHFGSPIDARAAGVETVYQTLAMSPALSLPTTCSWVANCAGPVSWAAFSACSIAQPWSGWPARNSPSSA